MRRNLGEPLDVDVDQGELELEREPFDLGQVWRDALELGRIGRAFARATPRTPHSSPGVIDMVEVAPGVFARRPSRKENPLSRIARLERAFDALRRELE